MQNTERKKLIKNSRTNAKVIKSVPHYKVQFCSIQVSSFNFVIYLFTQRICSCKTFSDGVNTLKEIYE